jgi:branched-chain amino acid transport system substrate-binding protein
VFYASLKKALVLGLLGYGATMAQAQNVLRLGVLNDKSSIYADLTGSGSVTAAQMAVGDFGGRVLNRRIEIVTADHQNKPDVGSSIARRCFAK